jgi:hypothetical protein
MRNGGNLAYATFLFMPVRKPLSSAGLILGFLGNNLALIVHED